MKQLKIAQLIGVLALILGVIIRVDGSIYGTYLAIAGALLYAVARVSLWIDSDKS